MWNESVRHRCNVSRPKMAGNAMSASIDSSSPPTCNLTSPCADTSIGFPVYPIIRSLFPLDPGVSWSTSAAFLPPSVLP